MNFLQRTPFLRLLFPLITGIIFYQYVHFNAVLLLSLTSIGLVMILFTFIIQKKELNFKFRWLFGIGTFFLLFVTGIFISQLKDENSEFQHINVKGIFDVELTEAPVEKANSYLCRITTITFFDSLQRAFPTKGKAIIYIAKDSLAAQLKSGDRILIETTFQKPDKALNPNGFDYAAYLKRQEIGATAYITNENWKKTGSNPDFSFFRLAEKSQQNLLNIYRSFGIEGDEYAVLAALTLGSKDALHPELRQNYTTSGGMHVLAVSGLHVGVIYIVLGFLLRF